MVIEISPKQKYKKISPFLLIGVAVCLITAVVVGGSYLYFYLNIKKIDEAIKEKNQQGARITQDISKKEAELAPIRTKINEFSKLFSAHNSPLAALEFLEDNCLPRVWFSGFIFNSEDKQATLSGQTDELATLEQQIAVLREQPEVISLKVSNVSIDENEEVGFALNIIFNSSILIPQLTD